MTNDSKFYEYQYWISANEPKQIDLKQQSIIKFVVNPKVSIVVPVWNTPKQFLTDMIESVLAQTYSNWELCIADGASKENHIREVLDHYVKKDNRIKVKYLSQNKGIAGNSNEAVSFATGDYVALLDHDDLLAPFALFEVAKAVNEIPDVDFIYSDEDKISEDGSKRMDPHFKPDFSPDTLRSYNYICHLSVIKKELLDEVGWFKEGFDGSQDYDLILRATEKAKKIVHIPKILYHWRMSQNSTALNQESKLYAYKSAKKALRDHLKRLKIDGTVTDGLFLSSYKVIYPIKEDPKVSIIIPNKDHKTDLERCITSIIDKSTYKNYEIIIMENHSTDKSLFKYYKVLQKEYKNISVIKWNDPFNFGTINNFAATKASGDILLFLNNDIEVITPEWLEEMVQHVQRKEVGIVGSKLYFPTNIIQHAGVIVGIGGVAGHSHKYYLRNADGYFGRLKVTQNLSAVTGACLMMRKEVFNEVKGFNEDYPLAISDVDLCLKALTNGYLVVWTPYVELYHYESQTRGMDYDSEKQKRFLKEIDLFKTLWKDFLIKGDPYYNLNLTLNFENFDLNFISRAK